MASKFTKKTLDQNSDFKPKRSRRKKPEIVSERKCTWGKGSNICGKVYGSYAALYTHIKLKHAEGKNDEETKEVCSWFLDQSIFFFFISLKNSLIYFKVFKECIEEKDISQVKPQAGRPEGFRVVRNFW